jgi:excisionase family DNA binding protein
MPRLFSSSEVGRLLGADPSSVNRWIDAGRLRAHRTPGGHRRVREEDLRGFLAELGLPVPDELAEPAAPMVLLCEPDPHQLRALRRSLLRSHPSLEVLSATSALESLIQIGVYRPDLVLLDVDMPGLDWPEALSTILSHPVTGTIRLVSCAARPAPELEQRLRAAGALAVLAKPVKAAALLELLPPLAARR